MKKKLYSKNSGYRIHLDAFGLILFFNFLVNQLIIGQSVSFKTYKNPVIPGDHPDCTVSQIGNDFYTTGSSFNLEPQIYHSTDLVHWRVIARSVSAAWEGFGDSPGGGCWGGQMVYYNNKYWVYFSRANVMYFTTANKPEGPWSLPTRVNDPPQLPFTLGYDNSIFIDDNNKWYLVVKNGQPNNAIVELGNDGQPTGVVYNISWLNPAPSYPYSWAEGPVMWKYKGYYYYSFARDLAGGQKVMRSQTLTDSQSAWEMLGDLFNENDPLKPSSLFASPNHSSAVVMASDSSYWVVHPLYAKDEWKGQGRQGLLNQVVYDSIGKPTAFYPINTSFTAPKLPSSGIPWMVPKSDFFDGILLNPEWQFYGYTPANLYSLTEKPGWLRLTSKPNNRFIYLSKNDGEHNYSLITRLDFNPVSLNNEAGLVIMRGDEKQFVKLVSTLNDLGRKVIKFSYKDIVYQDDNTIDDYLWLKILRLNHQIIGYYSFNGIDWKQVGRSFDISEIDSYSDFSTFTGTRQGLYVQNGTALFDFYIYRDAYSSILAECPANEFGTRPTSKSQGISILDSIHHNDWALYAGVEFGTSNYAKVSDSIEFDVSSPNAGGTIEVWLDSIDTGTKMATCAIENTGDWNTYKQLKVKTLRVNGRHDVYLKFTGNPGQRLIKLKSFRFIPIYAPEFCKAITSENGEKIFVTLSKPIQISDSIIGFEVKAESVTKDIKGVYIDPTYDNRIIIELNTPIDPNATVSLSYAKGNVLSVDTMELVDFSDKRVENLVFGSKPILRSAFTNSEGNRINLTFSKGIRLNAQQCAKFTLKKNALLEISPIGCNCLNEDSSSYELLFEPRWYYEDTLLLSYNDSDLSGINGGNLAPIHDMLVNNLAMGYPLQLIKVSILKSGSTYPRISLKFNTKVIYYEDQKDHFQLLINGKLATIKSISGGADSIVLTFSPGAKNGDTLLLSYSDGQIQSNYRGRLPNFSDYPINLSTQVPIIINNNNTEIFEIYPNPTSNWITLKSKIPVSEIKIYNLQGTLVACHRLTNIQQSIIPLNLVRGVYVVQVMGDNWTHQSKLVIK
jgi:beta-xylosidase